MGLPRGLRASPALPPPLPRSLRCLEDCGHGACSGPPDFTCMCDLGWTSDPPPPTPAPGPPAPRCSRDCGCNFHSHCRRRGPGFCDECQGELPSPQTPLDWPQGNLFGGFSFLFSVWASVFLTQLWVPPPRCLLPTPDRLQCHASLCRASLPPPGTCYCPRSGPWLSALEAVEWGQESAEPGGQAPSHPCP